MSSYRVLEDFLQMSGWEIGNYQILCNGEGQTEDL